MSMKRTRPIFGKYWIESPRMVHKGEIISIRMKISQVQMLFHGTVKTGEIERGRVDGEESDSNRDADADSGRRDRGS